MHRSRSFQSAPKLSKKSCLNLLLSVQFLLSSFCLPLPSMAADLPAATHAAAEQAAVDEAPSGWESAANDFIRKENKALETPATTNTAPAPTAAAASEPATSDVAPQSAAEEKPTSLFDIESAKAPATTTDEKSTSPAAEPVSSASTDAPAPTSVSTVDSTKTDAPSSNDGKQLADTTGATSEVKEVRPGDNAVSKDGIGGFVGEGLDGGVGLLEQGFVDQGVRETLGEVIVIDNDEAVEVEETIAYEELPTDEGKTKIKSGAQFPVVMSSQLNSKNNKAGDTLQARLKYDLKIGPRLIAPKGSMVTGHINYNLPARSVLHSLVTPKRWYKNSGVIGITFDEIINDKNEHIALNAKPARKARIIKNKAEGRELGVNDVGQITGPWGQQLKYKAIRVGLNFALAPAGVFSFGAMPVALGVIGAANPSFAFMKPVGTNVRHRRIKGFAWGFLSGIPGSWLIEDTVTKGQEAIVKPGDEFLVELKEEFTGEARSEATLMPGSAAKVRGQVLTDTKTTKSKSKTKKK